MRRWTVILAGGALAACGQSSNEPAAGNSSTNAAAPEKPKPAYCFFKESETKDWTAKRDKTGNVVVSGTAYREDSRYKAVLAPATISGSTAEVAPTISPNDTGFASPGNWWAMSETIPDSAAVDKVTVKCGGDTLASLSVPRRK